MKKTTTDLHPYKLPSGLQVFNIDGHDVVPEFNPTLIILDLGVNQASARFVRAYRWCYLNRLSLNASLDSLKEKEKVNLSSLCHQRVDIVRKLVSAALVGSINLRVIGTNLSVAFDWIDRHGRGGDLLNLESAKRLYRDYTEYLRHRMQLSNAGDKKAGAIGYNNANRHQRGMAYICASATGYERNTVRSWAYRIPRSTRGLYSAVQPKLTETEHVIAHAMHTRFFNAYSDAILNNSPPPVTIKLSDLGFEDIIFYNQYSNSANGWARGCKKDLRVDWMPYFYGRNGVFQGTPKEFDDFIAGYGIEPLRHGHNFSSSYKIRQRRAQAFSDPDLRYLANMATRHFGYLLLAEAGTNASTLATLDCSRTRLEKLLGATRLLAVKGRAGYEQQDQFVDRRFAQTTWKRQLELREWMAKRLREEGHAAPQKGLFLLRLKHGMDPFYPLSSLNMTLLSLWPKHGPSLATREARKHKTINIIEGSGGNVALASAMQFASPQTIERHYAHKNEIEAAKQISEFFELQAKSAYLRQIGIKPVRIINDGEDTSTGRCDAVEIEGPQLIEGYETIGITPRCSAPLTCLFCVHFGLHSMEEDLVRLLSIKRWVEVQTQLYASNIDEGFAKYSPYIERIDQIFEELPTGSEELAQLVKTAKTRFAEGTRDRYWVAKTNALLDLRGI